MQVVYTGQPTISRHSGAIKLPTARPVSEADQRTLLHRIHLIRDTLGIAFLNPKFGSREISIRPAPKTYPKMFSRHIKAILARLEVPAELGFAIDGNAG